MRVRSGRKVATRTERVLSALTAAGASPAPRAQLPIIDLPHAGLALRAFYDAVIEAGYTEVTGGSWPSDGVLVDAGRVLCRDGLAEGVYRLPDGTIAHVVLRDGWAHIHVAAPTREEGNGALSAFQRQYPPLYLSRDDEGVVVPITFWMLGRFGPERRLRRVDAAEWTAVARNYAADVRAEVDRLAGDGFKPGAEGQLLLWYGPPGTGKTWAIRALASAWAPWAEFHYITDPDAFFVQDASYMVDVLLHESYEIIDVPTGDLVTVADPGEKWRVLILEDTGELLSADAKEKSGQGLSRLLNVVDGMIGQGLRILVLVTTNDEIESLHPAVGRPGRCASRLVFGPLSAAEATEWAGEPVDQPMTLAELYARSDAAQEAFPRTGQEQVELEAAVAAAGLLYEPPPDAGLDPLTQAALDAAREPLPELEPEPVTAATVAAEVLEFAPELVAGDSDLAAALAAVAANHRTSTEAIVSLLASARPRPDDGPNVAVAALDVLREFAARAPAPPAAAPDVHVHLPEQPVHVQVEGARVEPHLHLPPQPPPEVTIGETTIHVAAADPSPVHVDVHVPEQPPAPAPVVNVNTPQAPPPDRVVRVVEDAETGARSYVVENLPPDEPE